MIQAFIGNVGTYALMLREKLKWKTHKSESIDAGHRGGVTRISDELSVMERERRGYIVYVV